jgi:signal transduction histidine kinase
MSTDSHIVLSADGTILAASDDLPAGIVDTRLEECEALPHEMREAGRTLLQQLRREGRAAIGRVALADADRTVQIIAIEAVAIRRRPTDLRELLPSKLAVISSQALVAHVTLWIAVADEVPNVVDLDAEKVSWAVTTLVGNALRYVLTGPRPPAGGRIDVRASFDGPSREVTLEVQDNGPGIPRDSVARLFKRDGLNVLGTGLALLVMSDVCAAHGGRIEVRSSTDSADHGTSVRLTLPV